MTSLSRTAQATLLVVVVWLLLGSAGCDVYERRRDEGHTRGAVRRQLVAFEAAFDRELPDMILVLPEKLEPDTSIALSASALTNVVFTYKESLPDTFPGTNVIDNWGSYVNLLVTFAGFHTNDAQEVMARVSVRVRSYGANRRDDAGRRDDLTYQQERLFPSWKTDTNAEPIIDRSSPQPDK